MGIEERKITIKLHCPSMAKIVQLVAWEDQKLDLGSIARAFGLDPATVKINGHFIGRGVDFIASSVTWKSLLSFFSARGLSTGTGDTDALTVDGKLSKLGSKRMHDSADPGNGFLFLTGKQVGGMTSSSEELQIGDTDFVGNKRLKESNAVTHKITGKDQITAFSWSRTKRKSLFGDVIPFKRERNSSTAIGFQERKGDLSNTISNNKLPCSYIKNMKRVREEDLLVAALCKRIRL